MFRVARGEADDDVAFSIKPTSDGGYVIAGGYEGEEAGAFVIKLDEGGKQQWKRTFGGGDDKHDGAFSILSTPDGGYVFAGLTESYARGDDVDGWVVKLDTQGEEEWTKTYKGDIRCKAYSIQLTRDGNYILAGTKTTFNQERDIFVVKLDAQGKEQWSRTYGGKDDDGARCLQPTDGGGYIVAGRTESYGEGKGDIWVIKLAEEEDKSSNLANKTGAALVGTEQPKNETSVQHSLNALVGLDEIRGYWVDNVYQGEILVVEGVAVNKSSKSAKHILLRGTLHSHDGKIVKSQSYFCGNILSRQQLKEMTSNQIIEVLISPKEKDKIGLDIAPTGRVPFMIVFQNLATLMDTLREFSVEVASVKFD